MSDRQASGLEGELHALGSISPDSHPARDAGHFRRMVAAQRALRSAEIDVCEAVEAARQAGDTWRVIGAALAMTPDAAHQRFTEEWGADVETE